MKLIDMLVKETIENGWSWPAGYNSIAQDECIGDRKGDIYAYINAFSAGNYWFEDNDSGFGLLLFKGHELAEDASTSLVTRQQYEAALAAKNEGWIEWPGGECPVPRGTLVDVKYLCGDVNRHIKAGEPDSSGSIDTAFAVRWSKLGAEYDIIAYRLHHPQEVEHAEADDEADLNECIGQDAAQAWSGEGQPPVGVDCECSWCGDEWQPCKILFASNQIVVVKLKESGMDDAYNIGDVIFRPIRSEADKRRDAAVDAFNCLSPIELSGELAYDAIAAGKIPGVKLED